MKRYKVILIDISLICAILLCFALFHHVLPRRGDTSSAIVITEAAAASTTAQATGSQSSESSQTSETPSVFTETTVLTDSSYSDSGVSIEITRHESGGVVWYVADIWLADVTSLRSCFADGEYGVGLRQSVLEMAEDTGAILAINGDYYGNSGGFSTGIVIRNGVLYRAASSDCDVCVLFSDGTMETFAPGEFSAEDAIARGAWQAWTFGPSLLSNGTALTSFSTSRMLASRNPRTGIGYYEPGHYCFVAVDGRGEEGSEGVTLAEFASIFEELGCTEAYNLDGGKSSVMVFSDELVNSPSGGGRDVSDGIIILKTEASD